MSDTSSAPVGVNKLYFAAWRWHFYAGIFVIPFLVMLTLTGGFMMIYSDLGNEMGIAPDVVVTGPALAPSLQAQAALEAVPGGVLSTYVAPESATRPAYFEISQDDKYIAVAVDPYTGKAVNTQDEATTWRAFAERVHGTLLLGKTGDLLIEAASSLTMVLIATGLYLWWPRGTGLRAFVPDFAAKGRAWWKSMHAVTGFWISAVLVIFMLSGLAWTGVWGDMFVKPWNAFPAQKWNEVPLSDMTHADLNHSPLHNVPWTLEATALPASGSQAGTAAVAQPVVLDTVTQWALANGFDKGQFKIGLPGDETGVYTVSIDGRNGDGFTPSDDRFVHIDRYTGNVLADVRYADYPVGGKLMAWGVGLHKGEAGMINYVFNLCYLALVLFLCVSGVVMWWKRRPAGAGRVAAPPRAVEMPLWKGAALVGLVVAMVFPLAGVTLITVLLVDMIVLQNLPALKRVLS